MWQPLFVFLLVVGALVWLFLAGRIFSALLGCLPCRRFRRRNG